MGESQHPHIFSFLRFPPPTANVYYASLSSPTLHKPMIFLDLLPSSDFFLPLPCTSQWLSLFISAYQCSSSYFYLANQFFAFLCFLPASQFLLVPYFSSCTSSILFCLVLNLFQCPNVRSLKALVYRSLPLVPTGKYRLPSAQIAFTIIAECANSHCVLPYDL